MNYVYTFTIANRGYTVRDFETAITRIMEYYRSSESKGGSWKKWIVRIDLNTGLPDVSMEVYGGYLQ